MKRIILTGGGTAGHVTPNLALVPHLLDRGYDVHYVGTEKGIERTLIRDIPGVTFHAVSSGKLRRYFSLQNFVDPFRVIKGMFQAAGIVRRLKPGLIFSKGGFVSVPVVAGGRLRGVPVLLHESDMTPGLANKLCAPMAKTICVSFEDTLGGIKKGRGVFTGTPIRRELYNGDADRARMLCGFENDGKPVLLIMGGSLGAKALNDAVASALDALSGRFNVIHICGKGKLAGVGPRPGYKQFEYLGEELADVFALTDIVVSRAGANAIFEFLALKKPALLVPLPKESTRGDQLLNAEYFKRRGFARVAAQQTLNSERLMQELSALMDEKGEMIRRMEKYPCPDGTENVLRMIERTVKA